MAATTYTVELPPTAQRILGRTHQVEPLPKEKLEAGQFLMVAKPFVTNGGNIYLHGDVLFLIRRTFEAPYGYLSSIGNWVVQCPHGISVWSSIESGVADGSLALVP